METLAQLGQFGMFTLRVCWRLVVGPHNLADLFRFIWTIVTRCFAPVVAVIFPFGMVVALQGLTIFALFGAERLLASLVSVTVIRELSPVLSAVLVAAQGGSSVAAELGAMRIKEELDATEVMGVDGLAYHVAPRALAIVIACPLLHLVGCVAGVGGAFFTAVVLKGERAGIFWAELFFLTEFSDIWGGFLKSLVFGSIIGLVACYLGYTTTGGAAGVGLAVNRTVVWTVTIFIVTNYFLTSALFGGLG